MTLEIGTIFIWLVCSGADTGQCIVAAQEKYPDCEVRSVDLKPVFLLADRIEVALKCTALPSVVEPDER